MDVGTLTARLELEDAMSTALEMATAKVKQFGEHFGDVAGGVALGAAAIVTAVTSIGASMFGFAKHAAEVGDQLGDFSIKTGVAIEKLGPLDFMLKAAGGSLDQMNSMLMRLSMKEQADQSGKFAKALANINIDAKAFASMGADQKIMAIAEGFRQGAIHGSAMDAAIMLGGRNFANYLPILAKLTPELKGLADSMAVIWTKDMEERASSFAVHLGALEEAFKSLATRIGIDLMPVLDDLMNTIAKNPAIMQTLVDAATAVVHGFGYMVEGVGWVIRAYAGLVMAFKDLESAELSLVETVLDGFLMLAKADAFIHPLDAAAKLEVSLLEGLVGAAKGAKNKLQEESNDMFFWAEGASKGFIDMGHAIEGMGHTTQQVNPWLAGFTREVHNSTLENEKFNESVDKIVNSLLGIKEHQPETTAAIDKVAQMHGLTAKQIKTEVDAIDANVTAGQKMTTVQKAFMDQWGNMGTLGAAAVKTLQGFADAAETAHNALSLMGVDLQKANVAMEQAKQFRDIADQQEKGQFSSDASQNARMAEDARFAVIKASNDKIAKINIDFNQQQVASIQTAHQQALDAERDYSKKGLDLTIARLDDQENAEIRALDEQLRKKEIVQSTYETLVIEKDRKFNALRAKAEADYGQQVADADVKQYGEMLAAYQKYQDDMAVVGLSAADAAVVRQEQEYGRRRKALDDMARHDTSVWIKDSAALEAWNNREMATLKLAAGAFGQVITALDELSAAISSVPGLTGWAATLQKDLSTAAAVFKQIQSAIHTTRTVTDTEGNPSVVPTDGRGGFGGQGASSVIAGGMMMAGGIVGGVSAARQGNYVGAIQGGVTAGLGLATMASMSLALGAATMGIGAGVMAAYVAIERAQNQMVKARKEFSTQTMGFANLADMNKDLKELGKAGQDLANIGENVVGKHDKAANEKWMADVKRFYDDIKKQLDGLGDATGIWSAQQETVAQHARESLDTYEEVNAAVAKQAARAAGGLATGLGISGGALQARTDLTAAQKTETDPDKLKEIAVQLEAVNKLYDATKIHSEGAAHAISSGLLGTVMEQIKSGSSFTEAIRAAGPTIETLKKQLEDTGYSGGQAFDFLAQSAAIVNDAIAGPALDAAEGYTAAITGLGNAGLLDQDTFKGLAEQVGGTAAALEKQGFTHGQVMAAMQGDLQKIWEGEQKYGYTVDDTTQKLIDEGIQSGLIGEAGKSDNQKILDVLMLIATTLGATIPDSMKTMVDKSQTSADKIKAQQETAAQQAALSWHHHIGDINSDLEGVADHTPDITIPVSLDTSAVPSGLRGLGRHTDPTDTSGAPGMATGGIVYAQAGAKILPFVPRGTDTVPAMLTPGERVLTVDEAKRYGQEQDDNDLYITLMMPDGDVLLKQVVKARKKLG